MRGEIGASEANTKKATTFPAELTIRAWRADRNVAQAGACDKRWRRTSSKSAIDPAVAAFSESTLPAIGIEMIRSLALRTMGDTPEASAACPIFMRLLRS